MPPPQDSSSTFFGLLKDIVSLGLQRSEKKAIPLLLGMAFYTAVIGMLVLSATLWKGDPTAMAGLIVALLSLGVVLVLFVVGPRVRPLTQDFLATAIVLGFLGTVAFLMFSVYATAEGDDVEAAPAARQLVGQVRYAGAGPAGGVRVTVQGRADLDATTDAHGAFVIMEVPPTLFREDSIGLRFSGPSVDTLVRFESTQFPVEAILHRPQTGPSPDTATRRREEDPRAEAARTMLETARRDAVALKAERRFTDAQRVVDRALERVAADLADEAALAGPQQRLRDLAAGARDSLRELGASRAELIARLNGDLPRARTDFENELFCDVVALLKEPLRRTSMLEAAYPDFSANHDTFTAAKQLHDPAFQRATELEGRGYWCPALH